MTGNGTPKKETLGDRIVIVKEIDPEDYEKDKHLIDFINEDNNNFIQEESSTEDEQDANADDEGDADEISVHSDVIDEILISTPDQTPDNSPDAEILPENLAPGENLASPDRSSALTDMTSEADKSFGVSSDTELCDEGGRESRTTMERSESSSPEISRWRFSPDKARLKGARSPQKILKKEAEKFVNAIIEDAEKILGAKSEDAKQDSVQESNEAEETLIVLIDETQLPDAQTSDAQEFERPKEYSTFFAEVKLELTPIEEEKSDIDGATDAVQTLEDDADANSKRDATISVSEEIDEEKIIESVKREVSELSIDEMIKRFSERLSAVNTDD